MNGVVFTALYGAYYPVLPPIPPQGVPCVAFTDDPELRADGWEMRVVPRPERTPRLRAKWFKLQPHACLPEYDASLWVDAGWAVVSESFAADNFALLETAGAVFYPHRWRHSIREELPATSHPKYAGVPLAAQVNSYLAAGFPDDLGLLECTSIARRHLDPGVIALDDAWWEQNLAWSEADQLSLPYVLWKTRTPHARYPFTLDGQPWIRLAQWRAD